MWLKIVGVAALFLLLTVQHLNASVLSTVSSYEFTGYRMQHYLLQQDRHGTESITPVTHTHTQGDVYHQHTVH